MEAVKKLQNFTSDGKRDLLFVYEDVHRVRKILLQNIICNPRKMIPEKLLPGKMNY